MTYDEALARATAECQKVWQDDATRLGKPMTPEFLEQITRLCVHDFAIIFRHGFDFGQATTNICWPSAESCVNSTDEAES